MISSTGIITAQGGDGGSGCTGQVPGGSGGAIRLVAPNISVQGPYPTLNAYHYGAGTTDGSVRLEAFTISTSKVANVVAGRLITSAPIALAVPATPPATIKVTTIDNMPINANSFTVPVRINTSAAVFVSVQAQCIPVGTVPKVIISSETGPDGTINRSPLSGTLQSSTCSASIAVLRKNPISI